MDRDFFMAFLFFIFFLWGVGPGVGGQEGLFWAILASPGPPGPSTRLETGQGWTQKALLRP